MIFFTSDWHLGHVAILKHQAARNFCFNNIKEMDDHIIEATNAVVSRGDILYHLGDWTWKAGRYGHYRARLKVREFHCIRGNHDSSSLKNYVSTYALMRIIKIEGRRLHLCHYPMLSWSGSNYGSIHLYGHCHGTMEPFLNKAFPKRQSMDVGIDNIFNLFREWRPVSFDEILEKL